MHCVALEGRANQKWSASHPAEMKNQECNSEIKWQDGDGLVNANARKCDKPAHASHRQW
jgi:hypothetical protein